MMRNILYAFILAAVALQGCAVNPVTGERELTLVSEAQEIQLGKQNYLVSQQMQGGQYNVDQELTRYVQSIGNRLAAVSDRQLPYEFVVLNNSTPNAWALPGGKIAVNRGLLVELNNEAEVAAVLGHEVVHAAARHGAKGMERGMLLQGAIMATGIAARDSDYANLAVGGAQLAAGLLNQKYGRDAERESDFYGMNYMSKAGYDPRAAISLQETFVRLSEGRRSDWLSGLFASHPPSQERVDNNIEHAKSLPSGGELGTQRYQSKIAHIKRSREAYKAHDEGRKALAKGDTRKAMTLAQKAIRMEPREAQFHSLFGDAKFQQNNLKSALADYNKALQYNNQFFHYYVQRGLTRERLGDRSGARSDLEQSVKLLPTATALNSLGNLTLAAGDRASALKYYKAAAGSNSEPGKQASQSLLRLDLPQNPGNYIKTRVGLNQNGYVVVQVQNPTSYAVRNVKVAVQYPDAQGKRRQITRDIRSLAAGKAVVVPTGLGPAKDKAVLNSIRVGVIQAALVE